MSSGRSFSDRRGRRADPRLSALVVAGAILMLAGVTPPSAGPGRSDPAGSIAAGAGATQPKPLPPPEDDLAPSPPPKSRLAPGALPSPAAHPPAPRKASCPRCGYVCDPGWNHCVACGWDLTILTDAAEEDRLQAIAHATVGVTVGGKRNRYSTAFPLGDTGFYVTNARVLVGADSSLLRVRTYNNREYKASIVGHDLPTGVGVIKVVLPDAPKIATAPAAPTPPEAAWAVCYPIVLEGDVVRYLPVSLHRGRLTATGQAGTSFVSFENLLRTDHAIEDGCTGGPLVDSRGRIAGMILGGPEDGITFVTPLDAVSGIVVPLAAGQTPRRPYFGIGLVMSDERRRVRFGLESQTSEPVVAYVIPDSPAAKAGIRAGDLLRAIGGNPVTAIPAAGTRLLAAQPGGAGVTLTVKRAGHDQEVRVAPVQRPDRVLLDPIDEIQETLQANIKEVLEGPSMQRGLVVSDLDRGGRGEKSLYRNGDIILSVNDKSVKNIQQFNAVIRGLFEKVFGNARPDERRLPSSYFAYLEIRTAGGEKVTRNYLSLFPDILAPPVY